MKQIIIATLLCMLSITSYSQSLLSRIQERKQQMLERKIEKNERNGLIGSINISEKTLLNIPYGISENEKLDIYLPVYESNHKSLVMVHGGAWKIGDKRHGSFIENKVNYFTNKGYTVFAVNYDLFPNISVERQVQEIYEAVNFIQQNSQLWNVKSDKLLLLGHSAGAHLVSLVTSGSMLDSLKYNILGTISLDSAVYDIPQLMSQKNHYKFYDEVFGQDPIYWEKMSPYYQIKSHRPNMYIVCSTLRKESCQQAESFAQKSLMLGNNIIVSKVEKTHQEINEQLGSDLEYTKNIESFIENLK